MIDLGVYGLAVGREIESLAFVDAMLLINLVFNRESNGK